MAFHWINLLVPAIAAAIAVGICYLAANYTEFGARQAAKYDDIRKVYALVAAVSAIAAYFFVPSGATRRVTDVANYVNPFLDDDKGRDAFDAGDASAFSRGAQAQARAHAMAQEGVGEPSPETYQEPVLEEPFED
jgi:hypothetical protein